jgi:hypothetical protein
MTWKIEANISEKRAVSIFRLKLLASFFRLTLLPYIYIIPSEYLLITSALKMETARLSETLASPNQST